MPHDEAIIEAIKRHRRGQGAVTCISQPSVGGGESPDVLSWHRTDTGPYQTWLDEYKDSRADLRADQDKPHRQRVGCGDRRTLIVREGVLSGAGDPILGPWLAEGWGVEYLREDGSFDLRRMARYRDTKDRRTEDRILHDHVRKLEQRLKELEGGGQRRGKPNGSGLKPYHHEILDNWLGEVGGLKEIAGVLRFADQRLTRKRAMELAHEALRNGVPGFTVSEYGQDKYLERQQQEA